MGMEIERKFTVRELPENLSEYECLLIKQAYLTTSPVIRVRCENDRYYMTYKNNISCDTKSSSSDTARAVEEYNLMLTEEAFDALAAKSDGNVIIKHRYLIPYSEYTIELDVFDPPFSPLIIAEVEFPSVEKANSFIPPEWFLEDVTGKPEYSNSYLSRKKTEASD